MTTAHRAAEEHPAPSPADAYCETCRKPLVDGLTGVLDRHEWDRRATEAVAAARNGGLPVALILVDLDSFKSVNDTYGHLAGDAVLRAVAGVLADVEGGIVGRYGGHAGDEFLILLPGATAAQAAVTARRTQAAVRALVIPARASRSATVTIDGQTVSMGIAAEQSAAGAAVRTGADAVCDLLLDADVGLRAAKRAGGDLVCGVDGAPGEAAGSSLPRPRRSRVRRPARPVRGGGAGAPVGVSGGGPGADEVRIPLASFGQDARGGPDELVLSSAAAEHLHRVLTEALGRPPSPRVGLP